jgi:hypothetical protein
MGVPSPPEKMCLAGREAVKMSPLDQTAIMAAKRFSHIIVGCLDNEIC